VGSLKEEIDVQRAGGDNTTSSAVETTLQRLLQDTQERLVYCALMVLKEEIENYKPTPQELDYTNKIRTIYQKQLKAASQEERNSTDNSTAMVAENSSHESL
jgi:hypothetical protein